jgi:hypothetical protein
VVQYGLTVSEYPAAIGGFPISIVKRQNGALDRDHFRRFGTSRLNADRNQQEKAKGSRKNKSAELGVESPVRQDAKT